MPQRQGKCINFGLCTMADSREAITLPEGEDFSCPECGKMLSEVEGKGGGGGGKGGGKSKLALAAVAVALLGVGGYFLLAPEKTTVNPQPDPAPIPGPVKPEPSPTPAPDPVKPEPTPTPAPDPVKVQPDPAPIPGPVKKPIDHTVKKPADHTAKIPDPEPEAKVEPTPIIPTATSGTIIWEGTVKKGELISIENGVADKGVVSGKLPGVPVLIAPLNTKKVAIAGAPGPDSKYQRIVLRIQANGPIKAELSWSVAP